MPTNPFQLPPGGAPAPTGALPSNVSPSSPANNQSHPILDAAAQAHDAAKAHFDQVDKVQSQMTSMRSELDKLTKMGDAVTADDVIEGLGKMVAGGASPQPIIAMIAGNPATGQPPMPESGEALSQWLGNIEQQFAGHEAQLAPVHQAAQHQLGVSATRVLLGHHIADKVRNQMTSAQSTAQAPAAGASPANPLGG